MTTVISAGKYTVNANSKLGAIFSGITNTEPDSRANPFPGENQLAHTYTPAASTEVTGKSLILNRCSPWVGTAIGSTTGNAGVVLISVGGTQRFEFRAHGNTQVVAGSEAMPLEQSHQCPTIGNGITVTSAQTLLVTVTPGQVFPMYWTFSVLGLLGTTLTTQKQSVVTQAVTAGQTIFTYTPPSNFTWLSWSLSAVMLNTPYCTQSVRVNDTKLFQGYWQTDPNVPLPIEPNCYAGPGMGVICLPIGGIVFTEQDEIDSYFGAQTIADLYSYTTIFGDSQPVAGASGGGIRLAGHGGLAA